MPKVIGEHQVARPRLGDPLRRSQGSRAGHFTAKLERQQVGADCATVGLVEIRHNRQAAAPGELGTRFD